MTDLPEQPSSLPILVLAGLTSTAAAVAINLSADKSMCQLTDAAEDDIETLSKDNCEGTEVVSINGNVTIAPPTVYTIKERVAKGSACDNASKEAEEVTPWSKVAANKATRRRQS